MASTLTVWIDPICHETIERVLAGTEIVARGDDFNDIIENPMKPPPHLIICGPSNNGTSSIEVAQVLTMNYPDSVVIYATANKTGYNRSILRKNGFKDAFVIPFELAEFEKFLQDNVISARAEVSYRSVKMLDLKANVSMDFDTYVFLPLNKKYVKLSASGGGLRSEQLDRLGEEVSSLHIRKSDLKKFYSFTAQQLVHLGKSEMSATEKKEKAQQAIRTIVGDLFADTTADENGDSGFESGRMLLDDCREIIKSFISGSPEKPNSLFERLMSMSQDDSSTYSSAMNVSTLASLFSIGLQIGQPEEIAIAGLLRDIGLSELPAKLQKKEQESRSAVEEAQYRKHPEHSVAILKAKRMIVSEAVMKIIVQHHEFYDGSGFPKGISSSKIMPEAQLLAIADEIDRLMILRSGQPRMSPVRALKSILESQKKTGSSQRFDPLLLRRLSQLILGTDI